MVVSRCAYLAVLILVHTWRPAATTPPPPRVSPKYTEVSPKPGCQSIEAETPPALLLLLAALPLLNAELKTSAAKNGIAETLLNRADHQHIGGARNHCNRTGAADTALCCRDSLLAQNGIQKSLNKLIQQPTFPDTSTEQHLDTLPKVLQLYP